MSLKVAIESVLKEQSPEGLPRVRAIGGTTLGGGRWMLLEHQAINAIERGRSDFYLERDGAKVSVIISTRSDGSKFLQAEDDGPNRNSLLALPDYNYGVKI